MLMWDTVQFNGVAHVQDTAGFTTPISLKS